MKVLSILSQKGGTGKTTLAVNLSVEAARRMGGGVALIDLDPQVSATRWGDGRSHSSPVVVSCQASRLDHHLEAFRKDQFNWVLIDTAPHSETAALHAARAADLILIPCRPAIFDLRAIAATIELAQVAKVPVFAVLNAVPPRGGLSDEAAEAISGYGVPLAPVRISQRSALVHSLTYSQAISEYEPKGKGNLELMKLYEWVSERLEAQRS